MYATTISFDDSLNRFGYDCLCKKTIDTVQVNMGMRCNQSCTHCHVEAGPSRAEKLSRNVAERILSLIEASPEVSLVDLTGGAPELNEHFTWLVECARKLGRRVIDRCNLTVLEEPGMEDMGEFLASQGVEIVASLPCYTKENVDSQRGNGAFEKSIDALRKLNRLGYGEDGSNLTLDLVYNPGGAFLPGPQIDLEHDYKNVLLGDYNVRFNRLLTITNMPINRFRSALAKTGSEEQYMNLLLDRFNPETVPRLMCRSLVNVDWRGRLFDCDFNQVLSIPLQMGERAEKSSIFELSSFHQLDNIPVVTASHCYGCTAGAGSSCMGALK